MRNTGNNVGVNNVNFNIENDEIFVIMGLSGSGKSTFLRCLNRLIKPTAGNVKVDGTNLTELDKNILLKFRRKYFGMVFQNFGLFPYRTVLENAKFGLEVQKVQENERKERAREALKKICRTG